MANSKQLKDYLHLYLGCECLVVLDNVNEFIEPLVGIKHGIPLIGGKKIDASTWYNFKPILRPLGDMTEEERKEWLDFRFPDCEWELSVQISEAQRTCYLLSKHPLCDETPFDKQPKIEGIEDAAHRIHETIRQCCIEDRIGLCVMGDDDNEPCGWEIESVTYYIPLPPNPDEQPQQPLTDEAIEALAEKEYPILENGLTDVYEPDRCAFIKGYKAALKLK